MGLDDFRTDDDGKQTSSSDDNETDEEETQEEDKVTGLEAFRTSETDPSKASDDEGGESDDSIFGVRPSRWNEMSLDEKVKHVRLNYIEDYYPDYQPDERWDYARVVEVECVCDNHFVFQTTGMCLDCGRAYKDAGRTVIKTNEVDGDSNNE